MSDAQQFYTWPLKNALQFKGALEAAITSQQDIIITRGPDIKMSVVSLHQRVLEALRYWIRNEPDPVKREAFIRLRGVTQVKNLADGVVIRYLNYAKAASFAVAQQQTADSSWRKALTDFLESNEVIYHQHNVIFTDIDKQWIRTLLDDAGLSYRLEDNTLTVSK